MVRGEHYVTHVEDWDLRIVVDAIGIERVLQAIEGKESIWDIEMLKPFKNIAIPIPDVEKIRILHRVFTDCPKIDFESKNRRYKMNQLMKSLSHLEIDEIKKVLKLNSEVYSDIFPDLRGGIKQTLKEIEEYRYGQKNWKELRKEKNMKSK